MGNIYLALFIALFSFQAFSFTYQVSGFRKTVINTPISIFESSIPIIDSNKEGFAPFFDKYKLQKGLQNYYEHALSNFIQGMEIEYLYYCTSDGLICKGNQCDGVKVSVTGKVMFNYQIQEKMFYEIKDTTK